MAWLADEIGFEKTAANFVVLTPRPHPWRAAAIFARRIVWNATRPRHGDCAARMGRLATALAQRGIVPGDVAPPSAQHPRPSRDTFRPSGLWALLNSPNPA